MRTHVIKDRYRLFSTVELYDGDTRVAITTCRPATNVKPPNDSKHNTTTAKYPAPTPMITPQKPSRVTKKVTPNDCPQHETNRSRHTSPRA